MQDGSLVRLYDDSSGKKKWLQLVLPPDLQRETMQKIHSGVISRHLGEQKMLEQLKERFYWPSMSEDVKHWCRTCPVCVTKKSPTQSSKAPMQTIPAGYPMQVIAIDITGPLPESEAGNKYILVVGDYFTKWMEAYANPDQEARTVAVKLVDEFTVDLHHLSSYTLTSYTLTKESNLNRSSSKRFVIYSRFPSLEQLLTFCSAMDWSNGSTVH